MANRRYPAYDEACLTGDSPDLLNGAVHVLLVNTGEYVFEDTNEFLSDVPVPARIAMTDELTGKSVTGGLFSADNLNLPDLGLQQVDALILFVNTGVEATSQLVAYMDEANGLPLTPDSLEDLLRWSDDGIFKL
jgi:hypothetical protein